MMKMLLYLGTVTITTLAIYVSGGSAWTVIAATLGNGIINIWTFKEGFWQGKRDTSKRIQLIDVIPLGATTFTIEFQDANCDTVDEDVRVYAIDKKASYIGINKVVNDTSSRD